MIILDGLDLEHAGDAAHAVLAALATLAKERSVELWLSTNADVAPAPRSASSADLTSPSSVPGELPAPLDRFRALLDVVVVLASERDVVRLRLLKDHDNPTTADLHLRLDPHSMRIIDEDVPPASERARNPRRHRLLSGGGKGAEAEFGACAERWGMTEVNYSSEGHTYLARSRGVVTLSESDLKTGDFSLVFVSKRLNRVLSEIPLVRSILQTIWHQINGANQVFVVGTIQPDSTVRGGTGWGAELARLWKKPLFVYDQPKKSWFRWSGSAWELAPMPVITSEGFAGIGTQNLTDDGREAIRELFLRSFGDPRADALACALAGERRAITASTSSRHTRARARDPRGRSPAREMRVIARRAVALLPEKELHYPRVSRCSNPAAPSSGTSSTP